MSSRLRAMVEGAVADGVFPGAAFAVGEGHRWTASSAGRLTFGQTSEPATADTVYDIASLTKVVATTAVAMVLWDGGLLELDAKVDVFLAGFPSPEVTVRHLLAHTSGLPAYVQPDPAWRGGREARSAVVRTRLIASPGSTTLYSCTGFVVLQSVLEAVGGSRLDELADSLVFRPLALKATRFGPVAEGALCAPTTRRPSERGPGARWLQGEVHDPLAWSLDQVSGNAGLFSTTNDVARFCSALVNRDPPFSTRSVEAFLSPTACPGERALGWERVTVEHADTGALLGHTGYTGCSIRLDPDKRRFSVLLSNRVFPDDRRLAIKEFRARFHEACHNDSQNDCARL